MKRALIYARALLLAAALTVPLAAQQEHPAGAPEELGREAAREEGHPGMNIALWKLANFVLFAGALGWFLYKKGGPFFAGRTKEIQAGIVEAAEIKKEAEARYAAMEQRLAGLGQDVENLRRTAREESATEAARVRQETERALEKIKIQSQQEIEAAGKSARQQLRAFAAELAVGLAEQKIRERMTADVENRLVDSTIKQLERSTAQQSAVEAS